MNVLLFPMLQINNIYYIRSKRNENWEGTSSHGYQLAEQIVKIDTGTTWQSAGMRCFTPAKTGYDLGVKKTGTTCPMYDLTSIRPIA